MSGQPNNPVFSQPAKLGRHARSLDLDPVDLTDLRPDIVRLEPVGVLLQNLYGHNFQRRALSSLPRDPSRFLWSDSVR